jgi:hypothetical protein
LSVISRILSEENRNIINSPVQSKELEHFIRNNFTLIWKFYFRAQIPNLVDWRNFYGDLESWAVAGTVLTNQMHKIRDKYKGKGVIFDSDKLSNDEKFKKVYETALSKGNEITGVNASSISEISGIPRATVIRKLKQGMKMGVLDKDKNQLYIMKKLKVSKLKQFFDVGKSVEFTILSVLFLIYTITETKYQNLNNILLYK